MNWSPTTITGFDTYFSNCGTTAVDFNPESTKFTTIFPNPASDQVTIDFFLDRSSAVSIEIYSMEGRKVYSAAVEGVNQGFNYANVQVGSFSHGIYVVKLLQDNSLMDQRMLSVVR